MLAAFAELLHRVSAAAEDIPEIAELDLNPGEVTELGTGRRRIARGSRPWRMKTT
jgi:hypothetical protein